MHFFVVMLFFIKLTWTHHLCSHFSSNTAAGTLFLFVDELPITLAHSSLDSMFDQEHCDAIAGWSLWTDGWERTGSEVRQTVLQHLLCCSSGFMCVKAWRDALPADWSIHPMICIYDIHQIRPLSEHSSNHSVISLWSIKANVTLLQRD